jgi:hypothetical protein
MNVRNVVTIHLGKSGAANLLNLKNQPEYFFRFSIIRLKIYFLSDFNQKHYFYALIFRYGSYARDIDADR